MGSVKHSSNAADKASRSSPTSARPSQNTEQPLLVDEPLYPSWWTRKGFVSWYRVLPDDTLWNCYISASVLVGIVIVASSLKNIYVDIVDAVYNISYAVHIMAIAYQMIVEFEYIDVTAWVVARFIIDLASYAHYVTRNVTFKLACYYVRLHRPFKYLCSMNNYNLKGSILGTTLKYCYIFMVLRITWAWVWLHVNLLGQEFNFTSDKGLRRFGVQLTDMASNESDISKFISSLYIVNKMFIPIGMPVVPHNDVERVTCLFVVISGCLVVTGAAVATLSLVIKVYMSPEETFRSRYRLIIKEMKDSLVPLSMREKVQKFYRMYWHKQRAVSATRLLPTFPPTLPATVYTDIYFEATQRSRILRDLSYQFLSELAKKMETTHYIPGDVIIERTAKKSAIIYITYGDIEMLTAEDDITAILRFTRGTILTPCGGAAAAAVGRSHLAVRAATFCTAHVLHAADLWRIVNKYSIRQNHGVGIRAAFAEHIERVKRHYTMKIPVASLYKSSILHFNRNLMALKEVKDSNGKPLLASTDVFLEIAGCYIMRNRLDSTLTDESDAICMRSTFPCILQPSSSLLIAWHSMVAGLILMVCITHPYYLVYRKTVPIEFRFFDYVVTAIYIVDHIVHLSTGAHIEEGVSITFAQTSSQQMRSKWFVLDVVGTLPIFEFIGEGHFAGINKILRLPKVFRVLKMIEDKCVYHSNVLRFCSYTLLLLIACYLIASIQQAFMCYQSGYCLVTNFTHSPFWEMEELDEETVAARIIFGLYWAISMIMFTTHMETWGKENMSNVMCTLIILELCIVLRTFMEAVYSATIMVTTAMREDYDAVIATVRQFLIRNEVDPELRKRFITYLQLSWYTDKAYKITHHKKNQTIFYDLPHHVYQDIVGRNRIKYILSIPFMQILNKEELKQLASHAHLFYTSPNEILLNTGDFVNEIYVVVKGICEQISPDNRHRIEELTAKSHFGAIDCLLRIPSYYTVRAVTHVQIFCISRRHLNPVFDNPQIKEAIEYVKTQQVYARMQVRRQPFLKYVPPPPTPNREHFKLPRKHEPDFEYLQPFQRLGFLSILRYIAPRFTIRPDGNYLLRYEWVRVTLALISAMVFPNYTYLELQWPWLYYFTYFLDLSAVFDIFQRMLVGYYNKDGILVYHPSSTAAYYIKGPFIIDLIGCMPLENLETGHMEMFGHRYRVTPMEQFLMMNRLLQLYRFPSIMLTLHNYIKRRDIHMVICAVPLFLSMFNILTCMMIFNSVKIFYNVDENGEVEWLLEPFKDKGGSWIDLFRGTFRFNVTSSPLNLYLATHFWVVYETTTTGYAKFKPSNTELMKILFVGMAMSAMIITYFSVRIISIRAHVNEALAGFQQHMRDIELYMKREDLDPALQKELRSYYQYNWEKMGGIDYRGVLKLCDQITLRTDAILHIYGPTFAKCPLLAQCDIALLRMIGRSVRSIYFLRDMKIIEYDDVVQNVYFVDYGGVESRVTISDMTQVVRLPRGSLFGNLEGTSAQRIPMNIVATSRLHLLMINSQAFYHIMNEFPDAKAQLEKFRMVNNQYYILGNMGDFKVKMTRDQIPASDAPTKKRTSIIKYIYFQEGMVLLYLIFVSLTCIFMDLYNAGYQDNRAWLILTLYSLDMCFFLKILMQFSLPLLVKNKNLKTLLLPIRRMYFKKEFKYDMISCVPIELLSVQATTNRWLWFSWLRLNRMFRIVTVYKCLKRHNERINVNLITSTLMAVFIWFSLFVHATTCLWFFIGMLEEQAQPKSSWMYNDEGSSWCANEYICSLYFVITTFTQSGVGDIIPKKQSEVVFVTILMIISTMVFMVYVGEFSNIIQYQSFRSFSFYSSYLELQDFLKNNRVSKNLVTIVNKYTLHLWRESRGKQIPHFLVNAHLSLRLRVMSAAYMHHIAQHHIFKECEPAFLRQLVGCFRLYTYNEDMYVVKEGEITDCMYVIHTGKVREASEDTERENLGFERVFSAGSCFGVGLVRDTPYSYSYQTTIKSKVLTLHLDDWEYLLAHFPDSKASIHSHMRHVAGDMDITKWPGDRDQGPPPGTGGYTDTHTDGSNLPKFYPYKDTPEAGPSTHIHHQTSTLSTISGPSKRISKTDLIGSNKPSSGTIRDTQASEISTPTISMLDKEKLETEPYKEEKASETSRNVGIMKRITSTAKKLMGRYSDTDLNLLDTDLREELLLEEEATETLLKQLDQARRLSIEKNKKRLTRRLTYNKEEETEKHMITLDMNLFSINDMQQTSTELETKDSGVLHIRDDNLPEINPSELEERDTTVLGTLTIPETVAIMEPSRSEGSPQESKISSILKSTKNTKNMDISSGLEAISKTNIDNNNTDILTDQVREFIVNDTDIQTTKEPHAAVDTKADGVHITDAQPSKTETDYQPKTVAIQDIPHIIEANDDQLHNVTQVVIDIPENISPFITDVPSIPETLKDKDSIFEPDGQGVAIIPDELKSQLGINIATVPDTREVVNDSKLDPDNQTAQVVPDIPVVENNQFDADIQVVVTPDARDTDESKLESDVQNEVTKPQTQNNQLDSDIEAVPDIREADDSQLEPDSKAPPDMVTNNQFDADIQTVPDIQDTHNSQVEPDSENIKSSLEPQNTKTDIEPHAIPDNQGTKDSQLESDNQAVSEAAFVVNTEFDADIQIITDVQKTDQAQDNQTPLDIPDPKLSIPDTDIDSKIIAKTPVAENEQLNLNIEVPSKAIADKDFDGTPEEKESTLPLKLDKKSIHVRYEDEPYISRTESEERDKKDAKKRTENTDPEDESGSFSKAGSSKSPDK